MKSSSQSCVAGRNHRREEKGACLEPCLAQMKHRKQGSAWLGEIHRQGLEVNEQWGKAGPEPSFQLRIFFKTTFLIFTFSLF